MLDLLAVLVNPRAKFTISFKPSPSRTSYVPGRLTAPSISINCLAAPMSIVSPASIVKSFDHHH